MKNILARAPLILVFIGLFVTGDFRADDKYVGYGSEGKPAVSKEKPSRKIATIKQQELATVPQAQAPGQAQPKVRLEASLKAFKSE